MLRLVYLAFVAWASLFVAVLNDEASEAVPATTTTAESPWTGNPLIIGDLSADSHYSEETVPQVPALPTGLTYDPISTTSTLPIVETTTTVPLRQWEGAIHEEYGPGTGCTRDEASIVARAMWDVGASDASVEWMLYVISRESLCDPSAHNGDRSTGDDSYGLCQQNNLSGWFKEGSLLGDYDRFSFATDFTLNAESCAVMWAECGKGPWTRGDYGCSTPAELR